MQFLRHFVKYTLHCLQIKQFVDLKIKYMKILIIEDKPLHIASAEKFAQESGHEVVIINNYDDANCVLKHEARWDKTTQDFVITKLLDYDMVMTDLFLPISRPHLTADVCPFEGTEQPYGITLMLKAMTLGVKKVGIITDGNHHTHPMIYALRDATCIQSIGDVNFCINIGGLRPGEAKNWDTLFKELNK